MASAAAAAAEQLAGRASAPCPPFPGGDAACGGGARDCSPPGRPALLAPRCVSGRPARPRLALPPRPEAGRCLALPGWEARGRDAGRRLPAPEGGEPARPSRLPWEKAAA